MTWQIASLLVVIFVASAGLIGDLFHHARERKWLVVPGKRSSHAAPTPSGAGIVIVLMVLASAAALHGLQMIDPSIVLTIIVGGGAIAFVSWLDDIRGVPARYRLITQFAAALAALWWLGPITSLDLGFASLPFGVVIGSFITVLGVMWMSNLVNFMDGTDGLVGSQTIFVSLAIGISLLISGAMGPALILFVLTAAAAGFLAWNWHPAKVFLGDVGAVFIGYLFAVLTVWTETTGAVPLLAWAILLSPFIVDASLSTIRRLWRGHPLLEGHREFAFHRAVRRGLSHAHIALVFIAIDLLLLIPFLLSEKFPGALTILTVLAFAVCIGLWWFSQRSSSPFNIHAYKPTAPTRVQRVFLFVFADIAIVIGALVASFLLRFDFAPTTMQLKLLLLSLPSFLVVKLLSFWYFRLYKMRWHAVGLRDLYAIIKAVVFGTAVLSVMIFFFASPWFTSFPRSVLLIDGTLTFLLIASLRISRRMFFEVMRGEQPRIRPQELGDLTVEEYFAKSGFAVNEERLAQVLQGKVILVTGAAGSIGHELAISLCRSTPSQVLFLDQSEAGLADLEREISRRYGTQDDRTRFFVADVCDAGRMERILAQYRPDIVFHAAAYKQSALMERDVEEVVKVNVLGTQNTLQAAIASGASWFVFLSDSAVHSGTCVGMTKGISESMCHSLAGASHTKVLCVRFGNVLGSRGSVLSVFLEQIQRGGPITVTDPDFERRVMTVQETTAGILEAFVSEKPGTVLIEGGKTIKMQGFAEALIRLHALEPYRDIEIRIVGSRPGERRAPRHCVVRHPTDHPALFLVDELERRTEEEIDDMLCKTRQLLQFGAMHHAALTKMYDEYVIGRDMRTHDVFPLSSDEEERTQSSRDEEMPL